MSTRATYQIENQCFYIHHDGYLEGAAEYFYNMIVAGEPQIKTINVGPYSRQKYLQYPSGGFAENFIRGNLNARFTGSHDEHGDTAFQYTLKNEILSYNPASSAINHIRIDKFINAYHDKKVFYIDHGSWHEYATGEKCAKLVAYYKTEAKRFEYNNPNKNNYLNAAKRIEEAQCKTTA